ncbi:MAG: hypothetical protein CR967_04460 [Proteobacteria bacterium]|nr:MAG: hypothetical protein CR967_04460 [Pseudomonadota bacterium]
MNDVIIIGGGVAGLGAGITLGSSERSKIGSLKTLIIDNGKSDLKSAALYNVPFIPKGMKGKDALKKLKEDALFFKSVSFVEDTAKSIDTNGDSFLVKTLKGEYKAKYIILATGASSFDIKINGKQVPTKEHTLMPKPGKIKLELSGRQELHEGIYVAGLLSGVTTMYATALGSGVEAACAILSKIANKCAIIHDFDGIKG